MSINKYKKKPVIVEAVQWTGDNEFEIAKFMEDLPEATFIYDNRPYILIPTLEGEMRCDLKDYIIKGVQGEFYPCKPDIFGQTYELV